MPPLADDVPRRLSPPPESGRTRSPWLPASVSAWSSPASSRYQIKLRIGQAPLLRSVTFWRLEHLVGSITHVPRCKDQSVKHIVIFALACAARRR